MLHERKTYCVYIMASLSGTLYIGMTNNLHKRVFQHKFHRIEGFTDKYQVERLLYWESFDEVQKAINREKQLKGWRRSKKIALIEALNPHWLDLAREMVPLDEVRLRVGILRFAQEDRQLPSVTLSEGGQSRSEWPP